MNTDIQALSRNIANGIASESDIGLALRTVQTTLGCNLLASVESVKNGFDKLNSLLDTALTKFEEQLSLDIESNIISRDDLFSIITLIQKNQVAFLEFQRKIVQSPNKLFSDDLVSSEEKKLLALLKSFKSPEEKKQFLDAVAAALKGKDSNDFD